MKTLDLIQGSEEWQSARAKYFTASGSAGHALGLSKYQSRQELCARRSPEWRRKSASRSA